MTKDEIKNRISFIKSLRKFARGLPKRIFAGKEDDNVLSVFEKI